MSTHKPRQPYELQDEEPPPAAHDDPKAAPRTFPDNSQEMGRPAASVANNQKGSLLKDMPRPDHFSGDKVPAWANEPGSVPPSEIKGAPAHSDAPPAENHAPPGHETSEPPRTHRR